MGYVRSAVLTNYLKVARQLGVDAEAQMRRAGLRPQLIDSPDSLISTDAVASLLEGTARISQCETVGLRMSQPRGISGFGVVGLLLAQQRTMRDAWNMIFRYLPLINESVAIRIEESGDTALLVEEVFTSNSQAKRQAVELALASNLNLFRNFLGTDWSPRVAYFRHSAPRVMDDHVRIFRCRCIFDADITAFSFPSADLDAPNQAADPELGSYAARLIETIPTAIKDSTTARTRQLIHLLMPLQRASIKEVAQSLGFGVQKLQLALAAEKSEFSALLEEARREQSLQYLANTKFSISQIASLLGYTQPNSFIRWFSTRFDESPAAWRRRKLSAV